MKIEQLFKVVQDFACKDKPREALRQVHVFRREEPQFLTAPDGTQSAAEPQGVFRIEAVDGHAAIKAEWHEGACPELEARLPVGFYSAEDWKDLVCKGRKAEPAGSSRGTAYPDLDQAFPRFQEQESIDVPCADGEIRHQDIGLQVVSIDPALVAKLEPLVDLRKKWRWQFTKADAPVLLTAEAGFDVGNAVAEMAISVVIMTVRL